METERDEESEAKSNLAAQAAEEALAEQDGRILGVNARYYPAQATILKNDPGFVIPGEGWVDQSENPPPTLAVLVAGRIGDYACYVGHGTPEWVAQHGDKISFEEASCHFPGNQLQRVRYRL